MIAVGQRFVVVEGLKFGELIAQPGLPNPPVEVHDVGMILLDNLGRTSKPIIAVGIGQVGEVVRERRRGFGLKPCMRGSIEAGILRIIYIRINLATLTQKEIMLDAMRRSSQTQSFGANGLREFAAGVTFWSHSGNCPV